MADEDFELVQRVWAAFTRGAEDEFRSHLHPDIVAVPFGAKLEGKEYRGYDQVLSWWKDEILVTWEQFEVYPEHFERVDGKLLVTGRWKARGIESGVDLDLPATWVIEVRDGLIAYWQTYTDAEEARRDVGLDR